MSEVQRINDLIISMLTSEEEKLKIGEEELRNKARAIVVKHKERVDKAERDEVLKNYFNDGVINRKEYVSYSF